MNGKKTFTLIKAKTLLMWFSQTKRKGANKWQTETTSFIRSRSYNLYAQLLALRQRQRRNRNPVCGSYTQGENEILATDSKFVTRSSTTAGVLESRLFRR